MNLLKHHHLSLQSPVLTSLKSSNDFGKKGQFLFRCVSKSQIEKDSVTIRTCAVFPVKWTKFHMEETGMHAIILALFSEFSVIFGALYKGRS